MGFDTTESLAKIADYRDSNGYPWTFAAGPRQIAADYGVRVQSTKFGIDRDGVIGWRAEYGTSNTGVWEEWFQQLLP